MKAVIQKPLVKVKTASKKHVSRLKKLINANPAIAYGWATVIAAYLVRSYPEIPKELVAVTLLTMLGLSHQVQKIENKKTLDALNTNPPV